MLTTSVEDTETRPLSWVKAKGPKGLEGAALRRLKDPGARKHLWSHVLDSCNVSVG